MVHLLLNELSISHTDSDACDNAHEFTCQNGACVSGDLECDGHDDCGDNSDEIQPCGKWLWNQEIYTSRIGLW